MFHHLLVPLDGSPAAEAVLPLTATLALRLQAQVSLLHVLDSAGSPARQEPARLLYPEDAQSYLASLARSPLFQGAAVRVHVHGSPDPEVAASILWHADEWGADLVLLATQRGHWLRRVVGGGVARRVLRQGHTPLLVVRPTRPAGAPPATCRTILVALAASDDYEPAISIATELAETLSASVCFLHAVPTPATAPCPTGWYLPLTMQALIQREAEQAVAVLDEVEAGCRARGIWARSHVRRGAPTRVLEEAVQTLRADLLVMSTRRPSLRDAFRGPGCFTPQLLDALGPPLLLLRADPEGPSG